MSQDKINATNSFCKKHLGLASALSDLKSLVISNETNTAAPRETNNKENVWPRLGPWRPPHWICALYTLSHHRPDKHRLSLNIVLNFKRIMRECQLVRTNKISLASSFYTCGALNYNRLVFKKQMIFVCMNHCFVDQVCSYFKFHEARQLRAPDLSEPRPSGVQIEKQNSLLLQLL